MQHLLLCIIQGCISSGGFQQGDSRIAERAALIDRVKAAVTPASTAAMLQEVEQELFSHACMTDEWGSLWRNQWRKEVLECSHLQDCLLYTVSLQV